MNANFIQCYKEKHHAIVLEVQKKYDRKAKGSPLKQNDYCFILQPIANHQGSKLPFREFRWIGPYIIEQVLPNENYIV